MDIKIQDRFSMNKSTFHFDKISFVRRSLKVVNSVSPPINSFNFIFALDYFKYQIVWNLKSPIDVRPIFELVFQKFGLYKMVTLLKYFFSTVFS